MSITVTIPGGTAEILTPDELTPRRQRAVQVVALQAAPLIKKMQSAGTLNLPDGSVKPNPDATAGMPDVNLTEDEANLFFRIQDASIYTHLKSWTLDIPRPETIDAVQDIPSPVYDALSTAINTQAPVQAQFEPSETTLEDKGSPFGESGASPTP
ncbi:hypothetical protein ACFFGR_09165 [Arthrobacter liuii]|uniref:Tail assembly chaperone n=1 Tax=Arthrobacter liuii TaxID=1476996 RepID=A0ABQ2APD1_9MICC|nr:hypothetical protein [Arthrobacter liuii]GGH93742.1 hypothetical protein GCM10007170_15320 [Arthrobacter liuii]